MLSFLSLSLDVDKLAAIARRHDMRPGGERPDKHIRQVTPGNYRKHLDEAHIAQLNSELREVLETFGYDKAVSFEAPRQGAKTSLSWGPLPVPAESQG